jgi:hypothetical protein
MNQMILNCWKEQMDGGTMAFFRRLEKCSTLTEQANPVFVTNGVWVEPYWRLMEKDDKCFEGTEQAPGEQVADEKQY